MSRAHRHVLGDAAAIFIAYASVLSTAGQPADVALPSLTAVAIGSWAIRRGGLLNPRVTAMRWIELSRLVRVAVILLVGTVVVARINGWHVDVGRAAAASAASWALLVVWRSAHRSWLAHSRAKGRFTRRTIVLGTDRRAAELIRLFEIHPEAGVLVTGVVGSRQQALAAGLGDLWLGEHDEAERILARASTDSVVVCAGDISKPLISALVREEQRGGREVLFHPGLSGVDARRVKASPIVHEPLLYVDSGSLSGSDLAMKRIVDVAIAAALLLLACPLFAVIALLIKRSDGGPVFFRQRRVGRGGTEFELWKFRTMVVDAEARLAGVKLGNQRSGPLFKLGADPRVTRIGRLLRTTSLDELPQLINVLKGEMSLVGPRPALASEVEEFPPELHERHRVRPGITGLWQVEARDNPAFDAYHRLDLFYVDNWSLALDLVIMLGTVEQLLLRPFLSRRRGEMAAPEVAPMAAAA
jgi:exopolysaccharide biosynthesis polyprenyl glycosylphosphotransferase